MTNETGELRGGANDLRSFNADRRGSIAITFAMCLIVMAAVIGIAIDVGTAYRTRDFILNAADAAALTVVAPGSEGYQNASNVPNDGRLPNSEAIVERVFMAQVSDQMQRVMEPKAVATVVKTGAKLSSTVDFTAQIPTHFLGLFGIQTLPVKGTVTSVSKLPAFVDFYLLLDNSPSMGLGATQADIDLLKANTPHTTVADPNNPGQTIPGGEAPNGCAFACHDLSGAQDYYTIAKNVGVTMRIDVLRQATQRLMDTAKATATVPNQFKVSIDTFNNGSQSISPLTADLMAAKAAANAIDLMPVANQGANADRDTDYDAALNMMTAKVPASGTGRSINDPQKVVFFVTDGIADAVTSAVTAAPGTSTVLDAFNAGDGQRLIETINPDLCSQLKSNGVKVAVIYTTYLPLPDNPFYSSPAAANIPAWIDQVNPQLQACASPGYFFEVAPSQGIDTAMQALFHKAIADARISS